MEQMFSLQPMGADNMTVIYYQKSDGAMLQSSTGGKDMNIIQEKEDLEKSKGISIGTLVLDSKPNLKDKIVTVVNDQLVLKDDLIRIQAKEKKELDRQNGLAELKKFGITDDQLTALFGG